MCGGVQAASYDSHGIIQGYFQLFGRGTLASYWSGIVAYSCKGRCSEGFSICTQVDSHRHRMKFFLAITFPRKPSMGCLYVSCLSSFTPRYLGCGL